MHYLLTYNTVVDYVERRASFREQHLKLARESVRRGELILGGAFGEPVEGALLVFAGDSPDVAEKFAIEDPYVKHGLVTSWSVKPWFTVAGNLADNSAGPPPESSGSS